MAAGDGGQAPGAPVPPTPPASVEAPSPMAPDDGQESETPVPQAPPASSGEPSPMAMPTPRADTPPMSPLSMSPMSVVSDSEQDGRDEALFRLRRERLAHEHGLFFADDDGDQVISDRSDGQRTEAVGVRRRRGPRSPQASAVDSGSAARSTPSEGGGVYPDANPDEDSETVCSSPPMYSPTIYGSSDGSYVSSSWSSDMLHVGSRRRRRGIEWSPSLVRRSASEPPLDPGGAV